MDGNCSDLDCVGKRTVERTGRLGRRGKLGPVRLGLGRFGTGKRGAHGSGVGLEVSETISLGEFERYPFAKRRLRGHCSKRKSSFFRPPW